MPKQTTAVYILWLPLEGKLSLSTKSTGSKKMKPHLFRIAEKFAHGLAAHEFFCIGSDFPSAYGLRTVETETSSSLFFPSVQKIAPQRGTRPRLRIEDEGAAAPSCIPGEHMPVF